MSTVKGIKSELRENDIPRNYLLFVTGINFALRISDLLNLKVKDMREKDGTIRRRAYLRESKTNKEKPLMINDASQEALRCHLCQN